MADSIRWRVFDRQGNQIYLTQERWQHIIEVDGHPEIALVLFRMRESEGGRPMANNYMVTAYQKEINGIRFQIR